MRIVKLDKWMADWCRNTGTKNPRLDYKCATEGRVYAVAIMVFDPQRGVSRVPVTCYANSVAEVCGYHKRMARARWDWQFNSDGDLFIK